MTKRDIAIRFIRHECSCGIPYFPDLTEEKFKNMIAYTGDGLFSGHSNFYLTGKETNPFAGPGNGMFMDMFSIIGDKGAQEGDLGNLSLRYSAAASHDG